jgi:hypothetical protein
MASMFLPVLVQDDIDVILNISSVLPKVSNMGVKVQRSWIERCVEGKLFTGELNSIKLIFFTSTMLRC